MRGFAALGLALLFALALASLYAHALAARARAGTELSHALALEQRADEERAFAHAVRSVFRNAVGASPEELARNAAQRLAELEILLEGDAAGRGIELDAWVGFLDGAEFHALARAPAKCRACLDWSAVVPDAEGRPVPAALSVVDGFPALRVSRAGVFRAPALAPAALFRSRAGLGATARFARTGVTAVFFLDEGVE